MILGAGAGTGVIVPAVLTKYVDATQEPLVPTWGIWGTYGVLVPIITGAASLVITQFTRLVRNTTMNDFFSMYGIVALLEGALTGALNVEEVPGGRARRARVAPMRMPAPVRRAPVTRGGLTPTRISGDVVYA